MTRFEKTKWGDCREADTLGEQSSYVFRKAAWCYSDLEAQHSKLEPSFLLGLCAELTACPPENSTVKDSLQLCFALSMSGSLERGRANCRAFLCFSRMQLAKGTEWMLGSDSWIQILPQPLTSCVTSGKAFLKLFLHLPKGRDNTCSFGLVCKGCN